MTELRKLSKVDSHPMIVLVIVDSRCSFCTGCYLLNIEIRCAHLAGRRKHDSVPHILQPTRPRAVTRPRDLADPTRPHTTAHHHTWTHFARPHPATCILSTMTRARTAAAADGVRFEACRGPCDDPTTASPPRRRGCSSWLALAVTVATVATAATVALAAHQPDDSWLQPQSATEKETTLSTSQRVCSAGSTNSVWSIHEKETCARAPVVRTSTPSSYARERARVRPASVWPRQPALSTASLTLCAVPRP